MDRVKQGSATNEDKVKLLEIAKTSPTTKAIEILTALWKEDDVDAQNLVKKAALEIPEENFANYLLMEDVTSNKLDVLAHIFLEKPAIIEAIILNPMTSDQTIKFLAGVCDSSQMELILIDKSRLSNYQSIYDAMLANPRLTGALKDRIDRERGISAMTRPSQEPGQAPKLLLTGKVEDKVDDIIEKTETIEDEEEKNQSVYQQVLTMSIPEKIQFALKGPKEARALLVRDSNKIVSASVLKSPKVNDSDVEQFAKLRNVNEDILRTISQNRQWMRKQSVVEALAKNPKTPVPIALKLIPRMNKFSIKALANSREIAEPVRKLANKLTKDQG